MGSLNTAVRVRKGFVQEVAFQLGLGEWVRTKWLKRAEAGEHGLTAGGSEGSPALLVNLVGRQEVALEVALTLTPGGQRAEWEEDLAWTPSGPVEGPSTQQGDAHVTSPLSSDTLLRY